MKKCFLLLVTIKQDSISVAHFTTDMKITILNFISLLLPSFIQLSSRTLRCNRNCKGNSPTFDTSVHLT